MCVNNDGTGLYSTGMGHGDAIHVSDFDPYRKGQEVFSCLENSPQHGTLFRDAATGQILHHHQTAGDCGRCCAGNITDLYKGAELWGGGYGYSASNLTQQQHFGVAENYTIYWDGSLTKEILDHSGFSTSTGVGYGQITKFNGYGNITTLLSANAYSCNYTKGTPNLQADIVGDWREEAIWWRADSLALRMYITPYPTQHRIYTLLHDHHYRQAIAWQMCGYNQPPHTSFYLGSDFPTPMPPKATNGKLVWKGNTATWNNSAANWMDGDDAQGLIAGNSPVIPFVNGKSVMFETRGGAKVVDIPAEIQPEALTVSGSDSYTLGGTGSLAGTMRLDKMGEGSLTLNGTHPYTGISEVWEGDFWMNGTLTNSAVMVRRHANYGGKGTTGGGINTEYNAGIYIGGKELADTMTVNGTLNLVEGAKLYYDLSDNPTYPAEGHVNTSNLKNDALKLNGTLAFGLNSVINIRQTSQKLTEGSYLLAKVNAVTGNLSKVKVEGATGIANELVFDAEKNELLLVIKGVRSASTITWSGKNNANWDLALTANWSHDNIDDIFVSNDSVYFTSTGINRNINILETLTPKYVEVNSTVPYVFDGVGKLSGAMNLKKTNTGTLTINNRNEFTGKVLHEGGTLVMKYAPSVTNNGGIGADDTNPANFVVSDSAVVQITTANENTNRAVTFSGVKGGVLNVNAPLYWNGILTGTKMTKTGTAMLYIGNNNSGLNEMVLSTGTIKLNSTASVPYGVGKKLTLLGGTLETLNNIGAYLTSNTNFEVPSGATATIIAAPRCEYKGTLTGGGTLNWSTDYIRCFMDGNWSAFTGRLNINKNSANSSYEDRFIVNNSNGMPNAIVNLGSGVIMCYKNGNDNNGTTTIKIGMLLGAADATFFNAGLEVGSTNTTGTYSGVISGVTSVRKVGTGSWTIAGTANTYTGATTVAQGFLNLTGRLNGSGTISIQNEASMAISGVATGAVIVSNGGLLVFNNGQTLSTVNNNGTMRGNGTIGGNAVLSVSSTTIPGSTVIGAINFGGNATMYNGAVLDMQVQGGSANCDKLNVTGTLTCAGTLKVSQTTGTFAVGATYQLLNALNILGSFSTIELPELTSGMAWDTTELYTSGTIKIVEDATSVRVPEFKTGVLTNPTNGLFKVYTDKTGVKLVVYVTDLQGKIVSQQEMFGNDGLFDVDLTAQPEGIYLLRIVTGNESSNVLKLIKI